MKIAEILHLTESQVDTALKNKSEKSKISVSTLRKVYNRGLAAYKKSHRPGTVAAQWAMARVNSFLSGGPARKSDQDLWDSKTLVEDKQEDQDDLYKRWKKLINMTPSQIENFKKQQLEKAKKDKNEYPGLKPKEAASHGISSGVQSSRWIVKMKNTKREDWTPEMWRWAGKQVSFVSRMLGNQGPLKDEKGNSTRKLLSLKIWGHNPN